MSCDYCWPGNCCGACDPKKQVDAARAEARRRRALAQDDMRVADDLERQAVALEKSLER